MSLLYRKNMLWEGSRMFLPEHREQLQVQQKKSEEWELPERSEDQNEEMNWLLSEAIDHEFPITLEYFVENQLQSFCGFVEKVNRDEKFLWIVNGKEKRKVPFAAVYRMTLP